MLQQRGLIKRRMRRFGGDDEFEISARNNGGEHEANAGPEAGVKFGALGGGGIGW